MFQESAGHLPLALLRKTRSQLNLSAVPPDVETSM
jgi:hypothetical protein